MNQEPIVRTESNETRNRLPRKLGDKIREVVNLEPLSALEAIKHLKDFDLEKTQHVLAEKLAAKEQKRIDEAKARADKKLEEETKDRERSIEIANKLNENYLEAEQKTADLEREIRLKAFEKHKEDKEKHQLLMVDYIKDMEEETDITLQAIKIYLTEF